MAELVERYVHEVGRYLPQKEREEIEAELRSMIQDQLDDRYEGSPSEVEVASVLTELGDPRQMAASYGNQQYLVGPDLYPFMVMVLRYGWAIVPTIVVFLNVFTSLSSSEDATLLGVFIETIFAAVQAVFIFSAVVVLIFAIMQHSGTELQEQKKKFNPLDLPKVDDPGSVDRFESAFGVAFGTFVMLVLFYYLQVGGLTLRFNLDDPGELIPFPETWMILLIIAGLGQIILNLIALQRNRWSFGLWTSETLLEVFGVICLYFAIFQPFFEHFVTDNSSFKDTPIISNGPEVTAIIYAVITLIGRGITMVKLWNHRNSSAHPSLSSQLSK